MDTSKEYIDMCSKAKDIQGSWIAKDGDFVLNSIGDIGIVVGMTNNDSDSVWLPRQDQLQEMVPQNAIVKICHIIIEIDSMNNKYFAQLAILEQLWLAFVMKEKHNKVWNGDNWVEEDQGPRIIT